MRKAIVITAAALVYSLSATAQTEDNMDRIEVCKQNYRTLFGGEALTGQGTDPEMMDIGYPSEVHLRRCISDG